MREKLHEYVNSGDERLLKMLYAIAREYNEESEREYQFSAEELALLEEQSESYWRGDSKAYNWETVKQMITGKK